MIIPVAEYTKDGCMSGPAVKASSSWFPILECFCGIYSVFVRSISANSPFSLESRTKHTQTSTHRITAPVLQIVNRQQTARWQMNTVTELNTYLHFYYSYVLKFCLFVSMFVCDCACNVQNATIFLFLFTRISILVWFFFLHPTNMWVTFSHGKADLFKINSKILYRWHECRHNRTHLAKERAGCDPAPFTLLSFAHSSEGH